MATGCLFRSTLLVSVGKEYADLITTALAPAIRALRGVRHVDAVAFREWWDDTTPARPGWEPYGVLVVVESSSEDGLRKEIVPAVLRTAVEVVRRHAQSADPQTLELSSIDLW